jgi:hypothetical protein
VGDPHRRSSTDRAANEYEFGCKTARRALLRWVKLCWQVRFLDVRAAADIGSALCRQSY